MTMRKRSDRAVPPDLNRQIEHSTLDPSQKTLADRVEKEYYKRMSPALRERRRSFEDRTKTPGEATAEYQRKSRKAIEDLERVFRLRDAGLKMETDGFKPVVRKLTPNERLQLGTKEESLITEIPRISSPVDRRDMFKRPILSKDPNSPVTSPSVMEAKQAVERFMDQPPVHRGDPQYKFGRELLDDIRNMLTIATAKIDKRVLKDLERNMAKIVEGKSLPRDVVELRKQQEERWRRLK